MPWCHQVASHFVNQCWSRPMSPCGITRPQWAKFTFNPCVEIILGNKLGPDSILRSHLTNIGDPMVEIRRSYDRLISTMGFPIPVRQHLYIESGPRCTCIFYHFSTLRLHRQLKSPLLKDKGIVNNMVADDLAKQRTRHQQPWYLSSYQKIFWFYHQKD